MSLAIVIAAGEENDLELVRRECAGASLLLCADGGYTLCKRAGVMPSVVLGDLDSIEPEDLANLQVEVLRFPRDKNESDLELTLLEAHRRGATSVRILGALGGRLDHALFNLVAVLSRAQELGLPATIVAAGTEARLLSEQSVTIPDRCGWTCSLVALSPQVDHISLHGFLYSLDRETLHQRETRGLSNVVLEDGATITVGAGRLLCLFIEKA
jgi:thiamine pyrophosphokinase